MSIPSTGQAVIDTPEAADPRKQGIARTQTGAIYMAESDPDAFVNGVGVMHDGRLCVDQNGAIVGYMAGRPVTVTGRLAITLDDGEYSFRTATYVSPTAQRYDGTNDYATRGANLTGIADGKQGTLSLTLDFKGGDGTTQFVLTNSPTPFYFYMARANTNVLILLARNSAGTAILNKVTTPTYLAAGGVLNIIASWNLATTTAYLYINDAQPDLTTNTVTDGTIDYTRGAFSVGANTDGTFKANACIGELFFDTKFIDLSLEANRRKFFDSAGVPVHKGASGQLIFGTAPLLYAPNGDPSANRGTGGNFTITGELADCA